MIQVVTRGRGDHLLMVTGDHFGIGHLVAHCGCGRGRGFYYGP